MQSELFFWIIDNPAKAIPILQKLDGSHAMRSEVIQEIRLELTKEIVYRPSQFMVNNGK